MWRVSEGYNNPPTRVVDVLLVSILTLTTAVLAPLVCLAMVLLLPFSDRPTQAALLASWASYLALIGVVLL